MTQQCPDGVAGCRWAAGQRRHSHIAYDLIAIGERCSCGANRWRITFGGLLPARVVCEGCLEGFNIAQRLRDCGKSDAPIHRKVGQWSH